MVDYVERGDDDGRGYVEIRCPSCSYSIPVDELVYEGGGECPGCERTIRLHVSSHNVYGEWRNVPEEQREEFA